MVSLKKVSVCSSESLCPSYQHATFLFVCSILLKMRFEVSSILKYSLDLTFAYTSIRRRYIRNCTFLFFDRPLFQLFFSFILFASVLTQRYWCHSQKHKSHSLLSFSFVNSHITIASDLHVLHTRIARHVTTFFKCSPVPQNYFNSMVQYNLACRRKGVWLRIFSQELSTLERKEHL
jgi:hypothetical protein